MKKTVLEKYLNQYAEPESSQVEHLFKEKEKKYQACLIIPAFDETVVFFERLKRLPNTRSILVIIVINQPEDSKPTQPNISLFSSLQNSCKETTTQKNLTLCKSSSFDFILVDRFTSKNQIPKKQGVGLARKIGADISCCCFQLGLLETPWTFSTDADAILPDNYFSVLSRNSKPKKNIDALVFNFRHIESSDICSRATQLYEQAIKYYQKGLQWAGSPYAFYTLGSTLAFSVTTYSKVRGFPKRAGGEDFYLLNKMAKVGNIEYFSDITLKIEPRTSERVPFGTGPAVKNIVTTLENNKKYCYYDAEIFEHLKEWIHWATQILPEVLLSDKNDNHDWQKQYIEAKKQLASTNTAFIDSIQFNDFLSHCVIQCSDKEAFISQFHIWFDAFRTLKYIHFLQEKYLPNTPIEQCLDVQNHWS
ncbi:MAG: hypothetical protein K6L76_05410 [Agarilytica sp.]